MTSFKMTSFVFVAALLICLAASSRAFRIKYQNQLYVNTSSGYCEVEGKDKLAVGDVDYDDDACEVSACKEGSYEWQGCTFEDIGDQSNCTGRKSGNYPTCCELENIC